MPVPDFSPGEVLTAAAMDSIGLWLVKTQTIGSAVASVTVTGAFSADYDNYLITINGGAHSTAGAGFNLQLGTANTGYYNAGQVLTYTGSFGTSQNNNGSSFGNAGVGTTDGGIARVELSNPFLTRRTFYRSVYTFGPNSGGGDGSYNVGYQNSATSFTEFTFSWSGTMTGGTIRVYGFRN
jgi:hypothetical protein